MARLYTCCACKNKIINEEPVTFSTGSSVKRFHSQCANDYLLRQEENKKKTEVCKYLQEVLKYDKPLSKQQIQCILSLRAGQMLKHGVKVSLSEQGYPYEVILMTMKAKRESIIKAIQSKNFSDELSKTRYIMAIVSNSINDIYLRWMNAKKQENSIDRKLEQIDVTQTELKYVKTTKRSNDLNELW